MALQPTGQVSPDGRWVWNGVQWVPNPQGYGWPPPARPYESARFRSVFVMVFLAVNAVSLVIGIIFNFGLLANGGDLASGGDAAVIGFGLVALGFLVGYIGSLIPCVVLFCMWLHRVVRNMRALGAPDPRWTPGGAVGRCFIPFLNLVHPFSSVLDAWRGSDPQAFRANQSVRLRLPVPTLLIGWWAGWLGGRVISLISNNLTASHDPSTVVAGAAVAVISDLVTAAGAGLAILVVRQLTTRQDYMQELIVTGRLS